MSHPIGGDYGFKEELEKLIGGYDLNYKIVFPCVLTGEDKLDALVDCDILPYLPDTNHLRQAALKPWPVQNH